MSRKPRICIEDGCTEHVWKQKSLYWCPKHEDERRARISASLEGILADMKRRREEVLAARGNAEPSR